MQIIVLCATLFSVVHCLVDIELNNAYPALDTALYEDVLDAEQCDQQIQFIKKSTLLMVQFADAGIRIPRGILTGNLLDLGNYHQCLGITQQSEDMTIQGKYCSITVPLNQEFKLPWSTMTDFDFSSLTLDEDFKAKMRHYYLQREQILNAAGIQNNRLRTMPNLPNLRFELAVCIPKPCSTQQAVTSLLFNVSALGFQYEDLFCRLPDDKPWSPADTTAVVIFSLIGLLTLASTTYDLISILLLKKDPKQLNRLYTSFSAYTNGRRLMNFNSAPGTLHCLDGIRIWAMAWVVIGHSFVSVVYLANPIDVANWMPSFRSLWITSAPITVDTFFCLAGILLVYTTAGKMTGTQLIKKLPLFYLNRLLRIGPLLATAVLLQASYMNRMTDGPHWQLVENQTNYCRSNWWINLLHVQNFIGSSTMCLPHSWYIAIDIHAYIISPFVLFWVLGRSRKAAWVALIGGLLTSLTAASIYNFINNFPSGPSTPNRPNMDVYFPKYYLNTLTRISPFFVGMILGYVLHVFRGKSVRISWISVAALWLCAATISTTVFIYPYFISQSDWDNQFVDNIMNSFMRPAWGVALCWMVFACTHGYGGPVNWFLTLDIWKLPARISYAIFLFHNPLMYTIDSSAIAPVYFSIPGFTFRFLSYMALALVVAYFATLLIDAPCSTLFKILLEGNRKKPDPLVLDSKTSEYQGIETNGNAKGGENNENIDDNINSGHINGGYENHEDSEKNVS